MRLSTGVGESRSLEMVMTAGCAAAIETRRSPATILPGFGTHFLICLTGNPDSIAQRDRALLPCFRTVPVALMGQHQVPVQLIIQIVECVQPARHQSVHLIAPPETA